MHNLLKTALTIRALIMCLFILITGISSGMFFCSIVPVSDKMYMVSLLQASTFQAFPTFLINLATLTLIILAGFTVYGLPLALIILFYRSFAVGFCDFLLLSSIDSGGIFSFVFSFLLPQLLLCAIYLITTTISTGYSLAHIKK